MLTLYQVEWCPQCHRVRQVLTELGLTFMAVNVSHDPARRDDVIQVSGQNSVPVLVDTDVVVSGSEDIIAHLRATYPPPDDAENHAAHGSWRFATFTSLAPVDALMRLRLFLEEGGFEIVWETPGAAVSERLPDSYVLLGAAIPAAAAKAVDLDVSAVSAVILPLAVMPSQDGSAVVAADPVAQVWLYASPELRAVQAMVKKRLKDVFERLRHLDAAVLRG